MNTYKCISDKCVHIEVAKEKDVKVCCKCGYATMTVDDK